jgi:hypothetical protein
MHGNALDLKSLAFQGQYLPSDEAVTDFGVLVYKVRNLQKTAYECTSNLSLRGDIGLEDSGRTDCFD